ncbi:MAG TPA: hypothetical protein ENI23_10270 [bacterium]|nr:hypothetical protein [bacterium]
MGQPIQPQSNIQPATQTTPPVQTPTTPTTPPVDNKKQKRKKLILILLIVFSVLVLLGGSVAAYFLLIKDSSSTDEDNVITGESCVYEGVEYADGESTSEGCACDDGEILCAQADSEEQKTGSDEESTTPISDEPDLKSPTEVTYSNDSYGISFSHPPTFDVNENIDNSNVYNNYILIDSSLSVSDGHCLTSMRITLLPTDTPQNLDTSVISYYGDPEGGSVPQGAFAATKQYKIDGQETVTVGPMNAGGEKDNIFTLHSNKLLKITTSVFFPEGIEVSFDCNDAFYRNEVDTIIDSMDLF